MARVLKIKTLAIKMILIKIIVLQIWLPEFDNHPYKWL
jgi:hypothetical protein